MNPKHRCRGSTSERAEDVKQPFPLPPTVSLRPPRFRILCLLLGYGLLLLGLGAAIGTFVLWVGLLNWATNSERWFLRRNGKHWTKRVEPKKGIDVFSLSC